MKSIKKINNNKSLDEKKNIRITIYLDNNEIKILDLKRGIIPRSIYIRSRLFEL